MSGSTTFITSCFGIPRPLYERTLLLCTLLLFPSAAASSVSRPIVSRSGRLIKPPLEYWKGGRVILDAHMNVTIHECYDTSSLVSIWSGAYELHNNLECLFGYVQNYWYFWKTWPCLISISHWRSPQERHRNLRLCSCPAVKVKLVCWSRGFVG